MALDAAILEYGIGCISYPLEFITRPGIVDAKKDCQVINRADVFSTNVWVSSGAALTAFTLIKVRHKQRSRRGFRHQSSAVCSLTPTWVSLQLPDAAGFINFGNSHCRQKWLDYCVMTLTLFIIPFSWVVGSF